MEKKTDRKVATAAKPTAKKTQAGQFVFEKENFKWMYISLGVIVLGFILMIGSEDIYDTRKTIIAPLTVLAGFFLGVYAIMKKPVQREEV
jgi:drug/metabolite transporter (DMT)-like permease